MRRDRDWMVPLLGVAFVAVVIIGFAVGGEPPDSDEPVREIVDHYADNKDNAKIGALIATIGVSLFVMFAAYLRRVFRAGEADSGVLPNIILAGAIIVATGVAIDSMITFALAESADEIQPAAVQALQALWDNDFMPFVLGMQLFLLGTGISILRRPGVMPKVIGWLAIILGVLALTPIGFVAFIGSAVLILVMSVLLTLRARKEPPPTNTTAAPGAPVA